MSTRLPSTRLIATAIAATALIGGISSSPVSAQYGLGQMRRPEPHPAMRRAMQQLEAARNTLSHASHDFHGHRSRAIQLIDRAIAEVQAGINSDRG